MNGRRPGTRMILTKPQEAQWTKTKNTSNGFCPAPSAVATIGPIMSLDEEAAREKTLTTVLSAISKEADHLMEQEGTAAYAQAISQAWGYTETMMARRGSHRPHEPQPAVRLPHRAGDHGGRG